MMKRLAAFLLALTLWAAPVTASQNSIVMPLTGPLTMAQVMSLLNLGLNSMASTYSGPTPPAVSSGAPVVFQFWLDTSSSPRVLRIYDATSWVPIGTLDDTSHAFAISVSSVPSTVTGTSYSFSDGDKNSFREFTNASSVAASLPRAGIASQFLSGWYVDIRYSGSGQLTITPTTSTIDGASSLVLNAGTSCRVYSNGTNYVTTCKLGAPSTTVAGSVFSSAAVSNQFVTGVDSTGTFLRAQPSAANLSNGVTGSGAVVLQTSPSLTAPNIGAATATTINGNTWTAGSGTLTLGPGKTFVASNSLTFTGTDGSTFAMPVASDTIMGRASTDTMTNKTFDTAGTGNSFSINGLAATTNTGTGAVARAVSPALTTPNIGAATAASINGNVWTAGSGTLTLGAGKTATISNTLSFVGTDGSTITLGAGGTVAYLSNTLNAFASTTSAQLASVISDETGSGALVFGTSPTIATAVLNTPDINGGTADSLTSLGIRSTGAAFDIRFAATEVLTADRTLTWVLGDANRSITLGGNVSTAGSLTLAGAFASTFNVTATTNVTFPTSGTLATLAGVETLTNKTLTSPAITTPTGIVKGDVGLGNVDNTSDATKNAASVTLTNKTIDGNNNTLTVLAGSQLSGQAPIANGGTGASTSAAARVGLNTESVTTFTNANISVAITDRVIATTATAFTAVRTATLPSLATYNPGQQTVIVDSGGAINGANTLTITANGSDTINGLPSITITTQYSGAVLWPIGANKWGYIASSGGGGGGGSVTNISTNNGLTGGPVTTTGTIGLASIAADSLLMNASGSSTFPSAVSVPSCLGGANALTYNTTTHAWGCNTLVQSIAGNTGAFTLGGGLTNSSNVIIADQATGSNLRAGTSDKVLTSANIFDSEQTITYNASQTFDFSAFLNGRVTLTGNITSLTCSNIKASQSGTISLVQDGTGSRTMVAGWCSQFRWTGGTRGVLSTAINSIDALFYTCISSSICYVSLGKAQVN